MRTVFQCYFNRLQFQFDVVSCVKQSDEERINVSWQFASILNKFYNLSDASENNLHRLHESKKNQNINSVKFERSSCKSKWQGAINWRFNLVKETCKMCFMWLGTLQRRRKRVESWFRVSCCKVRVEQSQWIRWWCAIRSDFDPFSYTQSRIHGQIAANAAESVRRRNLFIDLVCISSLIVTQNQNWHSLKCFLFQSDNYTDRLALTIKLTENRLWLRICWWA